MDSEKQRKTTSHDQGPQSAPDLHQGRIVSAPDQDRYLDTVQLARLEQAFRQWAESSRRPDVRLSRRRMLIIFLLVRYTGAKLQEVLYLRPYQDIDPVRCLVCFNSRDDSDGPGSREVSISEDLAEEIREWLTDPAFEPALENGLDIDPGFVRRKFYERARECGFDKRLGGPEMVRKARAVELMQGNMPLPVVQMMLGHSTPNLTSSYVSFSKDEIRRMQAFFMERESSRKTSARNSFFGKIHKIKRGAIQAQVGLTTVGGHVVTTMITTDSLERLGLKKGGLVTAEVKAPWIILQKPDPAPLTSAENRFEGTIVHILTGAINTEYSVRLSDGTILCAIISTDSGKQLDLEIGDRVRAFFNCFAVVLRIDG
jgi:molybdate transport system regulatory protein